MFLAFLLLLFGGAAVAQDNDTKVDTLVKLHGNKPLDYQVEL